MGLSGDGAEPAHLPHHPHIDRDPIPLGRAVELASLASEILQDRAAFENGDGRTVRPFGIDDHRDLGIGGQRQKLWVVLFTVVDIDELDCVGQAHFFERDRDFPTVWRGPIIKINWRGHGCLLSCFLYLGGSFPNHKSQTPTIR